MAPEMLSAVAVRLLDRLEQAERRLLSWGFVDGFFREEELLAAALDVAGPEDAADVIHELMEHAWLFPVPHVHDHFRTRSAEVLRMLARLRQIRFFPGMTEAQCDTAWRHGANLVADFRLLAAPRQFPRRDIPVHVLRRHLGELLPTQEAALCGLLRVGPGGGRRMAGFQVRATERILHGEKNAGTIVCAGTGTGKTLAFYLPAFLRLVPLLDNTAWTKVLAVYPRNELLKDQLREAVANASLVAGASGPDGIRPVVVGALYGDLKRDAAQAMHPKWGWKRVSARGQPALQCPLFRCPQCNHDMAWPLSDCQARREALVCQNPRCPVTLGPDRIRLTRETLLAQPPDLLFTSTEMLNQRMASGSYARLFGIDVVPAHAPRLVLLDEVHTYEGSHGAHVALLLRRWRHLSHCKPHVVGLSATLEDAARFLADITGIPASDVVEVAPLDGELESDGVEYQVALRGDPMSHTSLLSTTIQTAMLMRRVLHPGTTLDPAAGNRVFAFTDNLDVVNRLFDNLLDAEGRRSRNQFKQDGRVLASARSPLKPEAQRRYEAGQSWDLPYRLQHPLEAHPSKVNSLMIERTMSEDPGVQAGADIVVATASLEVGYDDATVGAVIQHKAPRSAASFLQRKGRAGRSRKVRPDGTTLTMRPWTVVVFSDFGRDRLAYQDYEHTFSPRLQARFLPTRNRSLLRMQATYALLDWLSVQVRSRLPGRAPWTDLARPEPKACTAQAIYTEVLAALLEQAGKQEDFARYVSSALGITNDEVDALLWEGPRSVLLEAVPTLLRRLETRWKRASGTALEPTEEYGPPLPEFLQRTLFGALLVPEVSIGLPREEGSADDDRVKQMELFHCLTEYAPGRVSRRYGLEFGESHWLDPGNGESRVLHELVGGGTLTAVDRFRCIVDDREQDFEVYCPYLMELTTPPTDIGVTSNSMPEWRTHIVPTAPGHTLDLPPGAALGSIVQELRVHSHHLDAPIEVTRFTIGTRVDLNVAGHREPTRTIRYLDDRGQPAALGTRLDVDGIELVFRYPVDLLALVGGCPELIRSLRVVRFRDIVRTSARLPPTWNRFQRDLLVDGVLAAIISAGSERGMSLDAALGALSASDICAALVRLSVSPTDLADAAAAAESEDEALIPARIQDLVNCIEQSTLECLRDLGGVLWHPVDSNWEPWLRAAFKATLGASLHEAILSVCPTVDERDIVVDLEGDLRPQSADEHGRLWITETAVGGAGAVEAFLDAYSSDPRAFCRAWLDVTSAGDLERVAASLEAVIIEAVRPGSVLATRFKAVRDVDSQASAVAATNALRQAIARERHCADVSLMAGIYARLLRPGSSLDTDRYLAQALTRWDVLERQLGVAIDVRTFALVESNREESRMVLPPAARDEPLASFSALLGLLWRRAGCVRQEGLRVYNPFAELPTCDRLLVAMACSGRVARIDVSLAGWFATLEEALADHGVAVLYATTGGRQLLRDAVLRTATEAVDTGTVRVFPRIGGIRAGPQGLEVALEMPEAFQ